MPTRDPLPRLRLLLLIAALCASASAVQFDVRARSDKCLSDEVASGSLVVLRYSLVDARPAPSNIAVIIRDPQHQLVKQHVDIDATSDEPHKLSFRADVSGSFSVCFANANRDDVRVRLDFKHGVEAKDYSEVAKREHLMPVEKELRRMEDAVDEIHREMLAMRSREAAMRALNEATNARVLWFSFASIAVLVGVGVWQVLHLKRFFQSKKLI